MSWSNNATFMHWPERKDVLLVLDVLHPFPNMESYLGHWSAGDPRSMDGVSVEV